MEEEVYKSDILDLWYTDCGLLDDIDTWFCTLEPAALQCRNGLIKGTLKEQKEWLSQQADKRAQQIWNTELWSYQKVNPDYYGLTIGEIQMDLHKHSDDREERYTEERVWISMLAYSIWEYELDVLEKGWL